MSNRPRPRLNAGAVHATHFCDLFYPPGEKDPGVRPVGAVEATRAAVAVKTWAGVILITDSNIGAGLPAGIYDTP